MKHGISIVAVAAVMLAMVATTFATDYNGTTNISTVVVSASDMRLAPDAGNSSTFNILSGGSFTCEGGRIGEKGIYAELNVMVGGNLHMNGEVTGNENENSTQTIRVNIFGTAYIDQFKFSRPSTDDTEVVIGNGSDAALLTVYEGYLGKSGDASVTINAGSTMTISGDWNGAFKIDDADAGDPLGVGNDAWIDLVGGTLMVNALNTTVDVNREQTLKGNGVLGEWVKTFDVDGFDGDGAYIYTAVATTLPGTVIMFR
jgi:hypothetical protein